MKCIERLHFLLQAHLIRMLNDLMPCWPFLIIYFQSDTHRFQKNVYLIWIGVGHEKERKRHHVINSTVND